MAPEISPTLHPNPGIVGDPFHASLHVAITEWATWHVHHPRPWGLNPSTLAGLSMGAFASLKSVAARAGPGKGCLQRAEPLRVFRLTLREMRAEVGLVGGVLRR